MAITDTDFRNLTKSVKRNDYPSVAGGYAYFFIPSYDPSYTALPYDLSADWMTRDKWLRYSTYAETMWANAVTIATTKMQSLAYNISGDIPIRVKRAQQLLLHADAGKGWVPFIGKVVKDYATTDNGCFIELERYSGAMGARIKGIHHLDSLRCRRTGDTEIPVIYTDLLGFEHELKYWQVIDLCDMPDARAESLGQGECAAHRAWRTITKLAAIERYVFEKVSGRRPLAIHIVSGVTTKQLEGVVAGSQQSADAKGVVSYMGAALAGSMGNGLSLVTIPLAELPDGFNPEQERKDGYLRYAGALGLDLQELQPLSGQGLGTGTQSVVLDEKASGKGLAAFRQDFTHKLNELVLDDKTTFAFTENDLRDQKAKAEIAQLRGAFVNDAVASGIIKPEQGLQVHVDNDDLPREFLPTDETAFSDLSDTEKPMTPDGEGEQEITEEPEMLEDAEEEPVTALKETDILAATAIQWAQKRMGEGMEKDAAIAWAMGEMEEHYDVWLHQAKEMIREREKVAKEDALNGVAMKECLHCGASYPATKYTDAYCEPGCRSLALKEASDAKRLAKQEQGRAKELYEEVRGGGKDA